MFMSVKWREEKKTGTYSIWRVKGIIRFPLSCFLYCYKLFMLWPIVMHPSVTTLFCYGLYNQIQPKHFPRFCYHAPSWSMQWGIMGKEVMANWIPYIFQHFSALDVPQFACSVSKLYIYWTEGERKKKTWEASRRTVTSVSLQLWQYFLWRHRETVIYSS